MTDRNVVLTVLGPADPADLGPTLMHEHLLCDLTPLAERGSGEPEVVISLENVFDVTYRPGHHRGNHRLQDVEIAAREAALFKEAGGGAIVEVTTGGICPDPDGLAEIARRSGVHVVMGAGFYTEPYLDEATLALPAEALADVMTAQVSEGAWGTAIRCGVIGEIGCSWPLTPFERRSLQGAASGIAAGASIFLSILFAVPFAPESRRHARPRNVGGRIITDCVRRAWSVQRRL